MTICIVCRKQLRRQDHMTAGELRAIRVALGFRAGLRRPLSQDDFAALLGISSRGLRNYERGRRDVPALVAREARRIVSRGPDAAIIEGRE